MITSCIVDAVVVIGTVKMIVLDLEMGVTDLEILVVMGLIRKSVKSTARRVVLGRKIAREDMMIVQTLALVS
jgi:hypothetical protein